MLRARARKRFQGRRLAAVILVAVAGSGVGAGLRASEQANRPAPGDSENGPARRALVVGIGDYTASRLSLPSGRAGAVPGRRWRDLLGTVHDARAMREVLVARYGFAPGDVRLLLDQEATRQAILATIEEHLVDPAGPGDELVFYYAGHGSQVVNSENGEPDGKDESLVPADSRLGAPDVRDKELRRRFNRALDRGARLTVILDSCHSGSGVRGVPHERRVRGIALDPRDVADAADAGPALEDRDAVILSAAQDYEDAVEAWDVERSRYHGAFTLALLRAVRAAGSSESAEALFRRARAWLHGPEGVTQEPVLAGRPETLRRPFLGGAGGRTAPVLAAVEAVDGKGRVVLQAGWIHGLAVGSELETAGEGAGMPRRRLRVTALEGLARSRAEVVEAPAGAEVDPGDLFALAGWAVPPGPPLQVWMPTAGDEARRWVRRVADAAAGAGIALAADPTEGAPPTHVLAWRGGRWQLTLGDGPPEPLDEAGPAAVVERLQGPGLSPRLFVEMPLPPALVGEVAAALRHRKVELNGDPAKADYFLLGRGHEGGLETAWMLPGTTSEDAGRSPLPLRSRWRPADLAEPAALAALATGLAEDAAGLARVRAWLRLAEESPPAGRFLYELALRPADAPERLRTRGELAAGELYGLVLKAPAAAVEGPVGRRFVYVFVVDSAGRCSLLYPRLGSGSVENRFPLDPGPPYPGEIQLPPHPALRISPPFGVDTYYLLTTAEPVPDPQVLECAGVRDGRDGPYRSALEELLATTGSGTRGAELVVTPTDWSLTRLTFRARPAP